ncbi:hypothetical protein ACIRPP_16760 [Streptomyces sp. NPDC101219]
MTHTATAISSAGSASSRTTSTPYVSRTARTGGDPAWIGMGPPVLG